MKISKLLGVALLSLACSAAFAQNYSALSASNITDANGTKLAAGQICFTGTDAFDNPINFMVGGGGQILKRAICFNVANGAITTAVNGGAVQVPNPANTSPAGITYRVQARDTFSNQLVLDYRKVVFSGASFNLDNYSQTGIAVLPLTGGTVNGPLTVNGNLSVTGALSIGSLTVGTLTATNVVSSNTPVFDARFWCAIAGTLDDTCIQNALNAAGSGAEVLIPTGAYTINNTITVTKPVYLTGLGKGTVLSVPSAFSTSNDILLVQPTSDGDWLKISDFQIIPVSGHPGRHAIHFSGATADLQHIEVDHVLIQKLGGNAIFADGSGLAQGTPVLTTIHDSFLMGGVVMPNAGDTVRIKDNNIGGAGPALDISFQPGASTLILRGNNITSDGGIHIGTAAVAVHIEDNEIETFGTFTGSNGALIDLDGTSGSRVQDTIVSGNSCQVVNSITANCLRVNFADRTHIVSNRFGRGIGASHDIAVTSNATDTFVDTNLFAGGGPVSSILSDAGVGTFFNPIFSGTRVLNNGKNYDILDETGTIRALIGSNSDGTTSFYGYHGRNAVGTGNGDTLIYAGDAGNSIAGVFATGTSNLPGSTTVASFYKSYTQSSSFTRALVTSNSTALVCGNIAISAGWGTTAALSSCAGGDATFIFTITSSGTGQGANPTITVNFPDAASSWVGATSVDCQLGRGDVSAPSNVTPAQTTESLTAPIFTFPGTPVAGNAYLFRGTCQGR